MVICSSIEITLAIVYVQEALKEVNSGAEDVDVYLFMFFIISIFFILMFISAVVSINLWTHSGVDMIQCLAMTSIGT